MKVFQCDHCGSGVFFQNDQCVTCGSALGFLPDSLEMAALEPEDSSGTSSPNLASPHLRFMALGRVYRACRNGNEQRVCNWMIPEEDPQGLCLACRSNRVIPDLSRPGNWERWSKIELAKRRSLYSLLALGLSISAQPEERRPALQFQFLDHIPGQPPVVTGHASGCVTFDIAEADDAEREQRRVKLHEPYRTLVGHFRHELGHYFWDRWIDGTRQITPFRNLFGDESAPYAESLDTYYRLGPKANWSSSMVTAYASAHPWEDWAETWAHYLHIADSLEVAKDFGISLRPRIQGLQSMDAKEIPSVHEACGFKQLLEQWIPLAVALNSIHRSVGQAETYPFVLPAPVFRKLEFIHSLVREHSRFNPPQNLPAGSSRPQVHIGDP